MGNCLAVSDKAVRSPKTVRRSSIGTSKSNSNEVRSGRYGGNSANEMSILRKMDVDFPNGQILPTPHLKIFTLSELRSATSNFRPDTIIGGGGFGTVFKGWLDEKTLAPAKPGSGMVTAVEKLNAESMQGIQEWQSDIDFLGRLSHPNLVKLLGYCLDKKGLLLVYEFMAEGSLEQHLFKKVSQPLSWSTRIKILIGAARGLAFLHTSDKQVIYRDFKASNILLDSNYHSKLSDFGLAKNGPSAGLAKNGPSAVGFHFQDPRLASGSEICMTYGAPGRVMGTFGYPAPQDDATGRVMGTFGFLELAERVMGTFGYPAPQDDATGDLYGKRDDVYGFGVVLVEMLTGLRALNTHQPSGQENLVEWTRPFLSDRRKIKQVMDERLEGQYPPKAALKVAQLSLKCLDNEPRSRPSMKEVVDALEQIEAI